jgi:hypothetical protein
MVVYPPRDEVKRECAVLSQSSADWLRRFLPPDFTVNS